MTPQEGKIEVVTGDLGGGKTAYAVELAYEHLAQGGFVFTNIEMLPDEIEKRLASEGLIFDRDRLRFLPGDTTRDFQRHLMRGTDEMVVMCVIDEAHLDYNSRDWSTQSREFLEFVTLCRKLDIWLVFVTQDANDIDKQVRRKITLETACRNLKEQRIFGGLPFPLPFYFRVRFKMFNGRPHHQIDSEFYLRSPAWGLYRSKALLGSKAKQFESMAIARPERLKRLPRSSGGAAPAVAAAVAAFLCVF